MTQPSGRSSTVRLASIVALFLALSCSESEDVDAGERDASASVDGDVRVNDAGPDARVVPPTDGGSPTVCGDRVCEPSETCDTCAVDCGDCVTPPVTECNDGIDNDGDGLIDWQLDVGCWGEGDVTEASGARAAERGWTTFDLAADSTIIYVSSGGDDGNDGLTPETSVASPARGASLVRDGFPDFLLFRRGDTWRDMDLGSDRVIRRFKSGRDAAHPLVVSSYGDSRERPRFELDKDFIDDDGHERNFLAVVGLAFISFPKVPGDPGFNGADGGALRFVGTGGNILIEDNYIEYGKFSIQNVHDVEVRRNVIYRSYHTGTCAYEADGTRIPEGDRTHRPSAIFAGSVSGLLIEGNVFDENGWNPDVPEACATIYNHDLYLSGTDSLVVRENLILRASSIGIKMASGGLGGSDDIVIENNLFAEGEIGISMGGNADTAHRFSNASIRNNVFTDIGRSRPTTRRLTWYIELLDNDGTEITGNLLVNQPELSNPFGLRLSGGSNRDVAVSDNLFYGLQHRALLVDAESAWSSISFDANTFVSASTEDCLIDHDGGFSNVSYSGNAYRSASDPGRWFCVEGSRRSLEQWMSDSGESGAMTTSSMPTDPGRNLDTYASSLGLGSTLADFAAAARQQSRHRFRPETMAVNASNYIRAGFDRDPI